MIKKINMLLAVTTCILVAGTGVVVLDEKTEYEYEISDKDFLKSPRYNLEKDDEPPLSAKKAYELSQIHLKKYVHQLKDYDIESISLEQEWVKKEGKVGTTLYWCWLVTYSNLTVTVGGSPPKTEIMVLMNGYIPKFSISKDQP